LGWIVVVWEVEMMMEQMIELGIGGGVCEAE
jgi:hypothetical protein